MNIPLRASDNGPEFPDHHCTEHCETRTCGICDGNICLDNDETVWLNDCQMFAHETCAEQRYLTPEVKK